MADCAEPLQRTHFQWSCEPGATQELRKYYKSDEAYEGFLEALGIYLCNYYSATRGRTKTKAIAPVQCGVDGGRGFKVRWMIPGGGRSGGFRLGVLAVCDRMRVVVALAELRRNDPADKEFVKAFAVAAPANAPKRTGR
jgi:hypothetical protein